MNTTILGFLKQLKEEGKIKRNVIDEEFSKYIELNKTELDYMMIKKSKDSITLEDMEKVKIIKGLQIEEIKEMAKNKLKYQKQ